MFISYNLANLLTEVNNANGSTQISKYSYTYYVDGNQKSKTESVDGSNKGTTNYTYDGLNRLIKEQAPDKTYSITTNHIWDGTNIAADVTNGTVTKYIRGIQLISSKTGNNESFYNYNAHGDIVQLTNGSGDITKQYSYDAFGVEQNKDVNDTNPFRYCGEYFDGETESVYLRARYYSPVSGRFITEDPIRDGLNWYSYCEGNPVIFVDPSGYLREPGYNKDGQWSDNPDADDYGENSVAYNALVTLSSMWQNRPADREPIERLANMVRETASKFGYEVLLAMAVEEAPKSANNVDIILAVAYPAKAIRANGYKQDATDRANELYGKDADGTIHNAFKHAYWNALMAYYLGDDYAQLVGYAHEFGAPENLDPSNSQNVNMDLYNNYVGRDIAWNYEKSKLFSKPQNELSDLVQIAAESGYLVILR